MLGAQMRGFAIKKKKWKKKVQEKNISTTSTPTTKRQKEHMLFCCCSMFFHEGNLLFDVKSAILHCVFLNGGKFERSLDHLETIQGCLDHNTHTHTLWLIIVVSTGTRNIHYKHGCFNWIIPNHYMGNGCFTKHPWHEQVHGCLGFLRHL